MITIILKHLTLGTERTDIEIEKGTSRLVLNLLRKLRSMSKGLKGFDDNASFSAAVEYGISLISKISIVSNNSNITNETDITKYN